MMPATHVAGLRLWRNDCSPDCVSTSAAFAPLGALLAVWLMLTAGACEAADNGDVGFAMTRSHGVFTVDAHASVAASAREVWSVVTDYEHAADFLPGVTASRVIERKAEDGHSTAVVAQRLSLDCGLFDVPFNQVMRIVETPYVGSEIEGVSGDMKSLTARYELLPDEQGGTTLHYSVTLEPRIFVLPLAGTALLRDHLRKQFLATINEIRKRAAALSLLPGSSSATQPLP